MNKLSFTFFILIFLNNCSFNENSRLWQDKEIQLDSDKNIKKILSDDKKIVTEFNQGLKIELTGIKTTDIVVDNQNNFGSQNYEGLVNKIGNYKFSKLKKLNQLNFKPVFLSDGIIFFDRKGSIIRYDEKQKVIWKKNYYTKAEKKLQPKLNFYLDKKNLIVVDSIAKYYSINLDTGELNWIKNNTYPFNSEIKKYKKKIFVIDYKNTLKCYNIEDGTECWSLQTEDSFTISNSKYSLIIINDTIIFNNSIGDITAADSVKGLIKWQLPTQSSSIINESYNFKISKLVSDGKSIFFSNNKNEFYSLDVNTGTINWKNEINSNLTPLLIGNLIFTISNNGYLYAIEKDNGNIIRVNNLFINFKEKKRSSIYPIGFSIGNENIYLTNSDGTMIVTELGTGNILKIEKVSGDIVSEPFIFNNNLFVVRNGSIVQFN